MKKLAIIGSGDLGRQLAHLAKLTKQFTVVGFFDDYETKGTIKDGVPILGELADIFPMFTAKLIDCLVLAVGYKHFDFRKKIFEKYASEIPFATLIHPQACIDPSVQIGNGTVIYAGSIVDMNTQIGENVLIYNGCNFAHDVTIEAHCIISPGVQIAGFCHLGEKVNLGIGTIISDSISIIENTQTGAGAVVVKSILEEGIYVGIPAKKIQK